MKLLLLIIMLHQAWCEMHLPKACCSNPFPQTPFDYKAKGNVHQVDDFRVYEVGTGTKYAIAIYDIFGFDVEQTKAFCDKISEMTNRRILMPDYFKQEPWPKEKFPISDENEVTKWLSDTADYNDEIRPVTIRTMQWAESKFGKATAPWAVFGFCWGGKGTVQILADPELQASFGAGMSYHGSRLTVEDVVKLRRPVSFHAAGDDPSLAPLEEAARSRGDAVGRACEFFTYQDQKHGFCAARADYSNPLNVRAIELVQKRSTEFLAKNIN